MSGAEISLLAVTIGFAALVIWVYSPSRRNRLESYGAIPLGDDEGTRERDKKEQHS